MFCLFLSPLSSLAFASCLFLESELGEGNGYLSISRSVFIYTSLLFP